MPFRAPPFRFAGEARSDPGEGPRIFCDGTGDEAFREGVDLELSHWIPNRTPARYKADTSTGICLRFAADPLPGEWSAAINNHVDTDGILSAFALTHPALALAHRDALVQAAAMGDFMGWGDEPAQRLYQGLGGLKARLLREGVAPQEIYERGFERAAELLEGRGELTAEEAVGVAVLQRSAGRVASGEIRRTQAGERLAVYVIHGPVAAADLERTLEVPGFDAPLRPGSLLLPQARARLDAERVQLVSIGAGEGWLHDVWLPGYVWAETPDSWRPAGLVLDGENGHRLESPAWDAAVAELQQRESRSGRWRLARTISPFATLKGRGYPVVLSFMRRGKAAASGLPPEAVSEVLQESGVAA